MPLVAAGDGPPTHEQGGLFECAKRVCASRNSATRVRAFRTPLLTCGEHIKRLAFQIIGTVYPGVGG